MADTPHQLKLSEINVPINYDLGEPKGWTVDMTLLILFANYVHDRDHINSCVY